eukprot:scpid11207/ scgid35111/ 
MIQQNRRPFPPGNARLCSSELASVCDDSAVPATLVHDSVLYWSIATFNLKCDSCNHVSTTFITCVVPTTGGSFWPVVTSFRPPMTRTVQNVSHPHHENVLDTVDL